MVSKVGVGFHIDVTVFVQLFLVGYGAYHTFSLQIAGILGVTTYGPNGGLVTVGCGVEVLFGRCLLNSSLIVYSSVLLFV